MILHLRGYRKWLALACLLAVASWGGVTAARFTARALYPIKYARHVARYSEENNLSPFLVAAVIRAESRFRPGATSPKGAVGLMQIMPDTGEWAAKVLGLEDYGPGSLYDPEVNIRIGTWYLATLIREFDGDVSLGLAAYNAGRSRVKGWLREGTGIPYPETRRFVSRVLTDARRYELIYGREVSRLSVPDPAPKPDAFDFMDVLRFTVAACQLLFPVMVGFLAAVYLIYRLLATPR